MGAFNAHKIWQLKIRFHKLLVQHNMLVCVTQTHDTEIKEFAKDKVKIMEVLDFIAEYNPALFLVKIDLELCQFYNRAIALNNAVQQLHCRRLSVDFLSPE